jgi:hypothetical protein
MNSGIDQAPSHVPTARPANEKPPLTLRVQTG